MKRYYTILMVMAVMAAIATPLLAREGGHDGYVQRYFNTPNVAKADENIGCSYSYYDIHDKRLTDAQRTQLTQLREGYNTNTISIRTELRLKDQELRSLWNSSNPDAMQVVALQGQIDTLRDRLDQKWVGYNLEVKKIVPDAKFGNEYMGEMFGMPAEKCHHEG